MFSASDLEGFSKVCLQIASKAADPDGFVPVRNLLGRFDAKLVRRPLLVEGMLASVELPDQPQKWAVLVDSETYAFDDQMVDAESSRSPLASRLRNTIAHELVHSLAFRPSEFGVRLPVAKNTKLTNAALVKAIEEETERLSALLLMPDHSLASLLGNKTPLQLVELIHLFRLLGVSRYLLLGRINLLAQNAGGGYGLPDRLRNIAIGTIEWSGSNEARFRKWPAYAYFDRGAIPAFVSRLLTEDRVSVETIIPSQVWEEALRSGTSTCEFETKPTQLGKVSRNFQFSFERPASNYWAENRSLFLVRELPTKTA